MNSLKKLFSGIIFLFSLSLITTTSAFAVTWVLENGGGYWTQSGTFNIDYSCGLRGSCHWGYNLQQSSSCSGYEAPGQYCDSSRRKWGQWNYVDAYDSIGSYKYTRSRQYVFIPSKHGTTRSARYLVGGYVYFNGQYLWNWSYAYVNQYPYYNQWIPLNRTMYGIWYIYLSDVTSSTEPTNWYMIAWDATKVEY